MHLAKYNLLYNLIILNLSSAKAAMEGELAGFEVAKTQQAKCLRRHMGYVLGVSAFYHDSAAALVLDGEVIAAAQEERFTRVKHDAGFPCRAINYCLSEAFIEPSDLDAVVYYDNPVLTLDRMIKNAVSVAPSGRQMFVNACQSLLGAKSQIKRELELALGCAPPLLFSRHHLAHAASCFYPSPFEDAAILVIDGVGEWATCTIGIGEGHHIELIKEICYPHSLGLLYSAFTYYCGFKVNSGEYKLMGLAPYGEPIYADLIKDKLIDIRDDGSFRLNAAMFGFLDTPLMINERFEALFGGLARRPDTELTKRVVDIAASVQQVAEEAILKLAKHATEITGINKLAMAGGVALNCVANGRLLREAGLEGLYVQPAAGDAGAALGAALHASHAVFSAVRRGRPGRDKMKGALLGPSFTSEDIEAMVDRYDIASKRVHDPEERARHVARALSEGLVVGFFSGRMEFGPRALGARSILGDPRAPDMQSRMNLKIKFRESFRPFAPAILEEHAEGYFDLRTTSPYMLLVAPVQADRLIPGAQNVGDEDIYKIVNRQRSDIPAVTHVDYSARVQTVGDDANPEFARLLRAFFELTGCPLLVNTSFNVRGEPIVCSPIDAYRCFVNTDIDLLVLEDRLIWKSELPASEKREWANAYAPD